MQDDQTREMPLPRAISLNGPQVLTAMDTESLREAVWRIADSAGPTTDDASVVMTLTGMGLGHVARRPEVKTPTFGQRS